MAEQPPSGGPQGEPAGPVEDQARQQTGQQQVQLRIDESGVVSDYANAFGARGSAEEVILDFGVNLVQPPAQPQGPPMIVFKVNQRVFMNYYAAKRFAIQLSQLVRRHEEQFGDLELDVSKRRTGSPPPQAPQAPPAT